MSLRGLTLTMAQTALRRSDERSKAALEQFSEFVRMDEPRKRYAARMTGLDIHYDLGPGHPLLGRRMPDLDLVTAAAPVRTFTLLHAARPVLVSLGAPLDISGWTDRVTAISEFVAHYHLERNHQGLNNRLITAVATPANENADPAAPIARREPLGGLLSYYHRPAA